MGSVFDQGGKYWTRSSSLLVLTLQKDHQAREDNTTKELGGVPNLKWYQANAANLNYEAEKGVLASFTNPVILVRTAL